MVVVHLNGTTDWMVTQRNALLAWTGHTLSVQPRINRSMSVAHWGNSQVTGRGLVALAGPGQVYQVTLKAGEEYVAHPGNVVAYTMTQNPPQPYRFKSSSLKFQIPNLGVSKYFNDIKFFAVMQQTKTWRTLANVMYSLRTATRRTIWGDRLFLQFRGPTTLLLSSRASRMNDVLTTRDVNEIADAPAGVVGDMVKLTAAPEPTPKVEEPKRDVPTGFHFVNVKKDGKVEFESEKQSLEELKTKK